MDKPIYSFFDMAKLTPMQRERVLELHMETGAKYTDDVRRVDACVSACEGIETNVLEDDSWRIRDLLDGFDGCVADAVNKKCTWSYCDQECSYETECGYKWGFVDGDRHDNGAGYCMYCGGLIVDNDCVDFGG